METIQPMIVVTKYLVPKRYCAIAIFPFIFLKGESLRSNDFLLNHERIHLRQQIELLVLTFYIIYVLEFLFNYIKIKSWNEAYRGISFEKEAYENESDLNFLKRRLLWNFKSYF